MNIFSIFSIFASFVIGAVVTIILIAKSRGERPKDVAKEVVEQVINPNPNALEDRVEEQLIRLNENLRMKANSESVITITDDIINLLLEVVPRALKDSPNSEATFNLEKLSTDYLPDLLNDYFVLSNEDQISREKDILAQLAELKTSIQKAEASLDEGNLDNFQVSSQFLK